MPLIINKLLNSKYTRAEVEKLLRATISGMNMDKYYTEAKIRECVNSWGEMYGFKEEDTENEFGEVSP